MYNGPLPFVFEDRTGQLYGSDFDEMYDRMFYRVARDPQRTATMVYNMGRRASRHRDSLPFNSRPIAILDFKPDQSLGNICYASNGNVAVPMNRYLRRTSMFGGSLSRKFTGSDGREYKWSHRSIQGQEWTCTTGQENFLVAHFDLKAADVPAYDVSGNTLTIFEQFIHISVDVNPVALKLDREIMVVVAHFLHAPLEVQDLPNGHNCHLPGYTLNHYSTGMLQSPLAPLRVGPSTTAHCSFNRFSKRHLACLSSSATVPFL